MTDLKRLFKRIVRIEEESGKKCFARSMVRYFIVLTFFSFHSLQAQNLSKIDSLTKLLKNTSIGLSKFDLYEKICVRYIDLNSNLPLAWKYADSLKLVSEELKDKNGYFKAQYYYGVISYYQGNYNEGLEYLQHYIDYAKTQSDSSLISKGLFHVAVIDLDLGNYDKSLAIFYRILAIEEKNNNPKKIASIYNTIGIIYKRTNKFKEAIANYTEAAKIFKASNIKIDYGMSIQNIGNIYFEIKNYDKAKQCYEEALDIFYNVKSRPFIATVLGNLGNLCEAQKEYNQALHYYQQALIIWKKETKKISLVNCLNNLGELNLKLKKYNDAEMYLNEALNIALEIKANPSLFDVYSNINKLYFEKKDFEKAYQFYSLANQIKDTIFNESNAKQLNLLQTKYDTEKKNKQIALLAKEKEVQEKEDQRQATLNKAIASGLVLIILIAALAIYIYRQRLLLTTKNNQVKEADFKRQLVELEMRALRAQINPHFLFNCMNAINLMILKKENENASLYLSKFTKLVRLILENTEASSVTIESEMVLLESYIQLEELRLPGKIVYKISVDDSIRIQSTYIPPMVLQPVVENAIWHGIVHRERNPLGSISIDIRKSDDQLLCIIEDDGVGREKARQLRDKSVLKNKSMGIKITEERLRLLSRKQMEQCIQIIDLKDPLNYASGTRVILNIPIFE